VEALKVLLGLRFRTGTVLSFVMGLIQKHGDVTAATEQDPDLFSALVQKLHQHALKVQYQKRTIVLDSPSPTGFMVRINTPRMLPRKFLVWRFPTEESDQLVLFYQEQTQRVNDLPHRVAVDTTGLRTEDALAQIILRTILAHLGYLKART
jgi:hypothetical protein